MSGTMENLWFALVVICVFSISVGLLSRFPTPVATATHRVYLLDIASAPAIATCSDAGGLVGWLQPIDRDGDYVGVADVYCVVGVK